MVSDRADRTVHGSVDKVIAHMCEALLKVFVDDTTPYHFRINNRKAYGATMHAMSCSVVAREWLHPDAQCCLGVWD